MKTVLLHICCGVCGSSVVERLREEGFTVKGFFYNPNIHPRQEFGKRLEVAHRTSRILDFELIEGIYDKESWFKATEGEGNEPEGGRRCEICFRIRLEQTYKKSCRLGADYFATTLSVSPHKDLLAINKIGKELDKERFLERDFKKRDGFKKGIEFSKEHNLYRQNYCGCIYSRKEGEQGNLTRNNTEIH
ncbi:epoxyqueuosine reductase QueH [bacterium]|nr:epoxyqueuosine reductase QueH [bacterium]